MSGNVFPEIDDYRTDATNSLGNTFWKYDPETQSLKNSMTRTSDWYSGPGGESATKIGLAALLAVAGGSVLGGFTGGASGGSGGGSGGFGGGGGSGGVFSSYGKNMLGNVSRLGQMAPSGQQQGMNPILAYMLQKAKTDQGVYEPIPPGALTDFMR